MWNRFSSVTILFLLPPCSLNVYSVGATAYFYGMSLPDFIVVGSGCTGAIAAQTLAESGHSVLIIDGGQHNEDEADRIPDESFISLRRHDDKQEEYFLGKHFESIPEGKTSSGSQLTPARNFLIRETEKYLPLLSKSFSAIESLAIGGLGGGWGLGCCVFSDRELIRAGLNPSEMKPAYQLIADRIGISGERDDATPFTWAHINGVHPAFENDRGALLMKAKYARKKTELNQLGFFLGRPALALLTSVKNGRKGLNRRDMDFYDDHGHSAWRAWMLVNELKKKPNVQHEPGWLVTSFQEEENSVTVSAMRIGTNEKKDFEARKLILAPGPLGTARIVLRSLPGGTEKKLPIICNPYNYTPMLLPKLLGSEISETHIGLAQLSMFHNADENGDNIAMASIYSYHSLMLFRLLRETPLNFRDGRMAMRYLLPALMIAGIHHPETSGDQQFVQLQKSDSSPTGDSLAVNYQLPNEKISSVQEREKMYRRAFRKLGAFALKQVHPGIGSSVHYAGVLPFANTNTEFTLDKTGKLHGHERTFVADGSGFHFLPAKGLTLSLMANAHNVALSAMH